MEENIKIPPEYDGKHVVKVLIKRIDENAENNFKQKPILKEIPSECNDIDIQNVDIKSLGDDCDDFLERKPLSNEENTDDLNNDSSIKVETLDCNLKEEMDCEEISNQITPECNEIDIENMDIKSLGEKCDDFLEWKPLSNEENTDDLNNDSSIKLETPACNLKEEMDCEEISNQISPGVEDKHIIRDLVKHVKEDFVDTFQVKPTIEECVKILLN